MRRISTATKVVDKFGVGKHGFTNGNAVGGIPATDMEDVWCDHLQEEMANVIEATGTALDPANRSQLLAALRSAGVFQTPATGDRSTKAATTQMFANEFASSLSPNGYQKLPSGLIIQWGSGSYTSAGTIVTFPIAFNAVPYVVGLNNNGSANVIYTAASLTTTTFTASTNNAGALSGSWIAIGR